MTTPSPDISIVIPVFNEENNLDPLVDELVPVLEATARTFEIVLIDDGSTDRSVEILKERIERDARIRLVRFTNNYGQQMANTAGLRHARGRIIIIMDADLQTPPEDIPRFLEKLGEGYDIVYGVRERVKTAIHRRMGTNLAVWLINTLTGFQIPDSASGYLALDRTLVEDVNRYNERSRYLSGLFAWLSYGRFSAINVSRRPRLHGESNYTLRSLALLVINFVTLFSTVPLRAPIAVGIVSGLLGALSLIASAAMFFAQDTLAAESLALIGFLLLVGGAELFFLGAAGTYIGRIYGDVRENPLYVIREVRDHATEITA